MRVKAPGAYQLWLGGDVDRPMRVYVDGRFLGAPSQQSGDDGTVISVAHVVLGAGHHTVALVRGGGDLKPDDQASTAIDGIVLEPAGAGLAPVQSVPAAQARTLCGVPLDWVELGA